MMGDQSRVLGLGAFLGSGDMVQRPALTTRLLGRMGARWGAVLTESVDGRLQSADRVAHVAEVMRSQPLARLRSEPEGAPQNFLEPLLYTFPMSSRARNAGQHLLECAAAANVQKLILDLEPLRRGGKLDDWTPTEIDALVAEAVKVDPTPTVTLFTRRAWERIDWGRHLPRGSEIWLQVYDRVQDLEMLREAVGFWRGLGFTVVLLIGSYVGGLERLEHDLEHAEDGASHTGALGVWKLGTTDHNEAQILRRFAERVWPLAPMAGG